MSKPVELSEQPTIETPHKRALRTRLHALLYSGTVVGLCTTLATVALIGPKRPESMGE